MGVPEVIQDSALLDEHNYYENHNANLHLASDYALTPQTGYSEGSYLCSTLTFMMVIFIALGLAYFFHKRFFKGKKNLFYRDHKEPIIPIAVTPPMVSSPKFESKSPRKQVMASTDDLHD